MKPKLTVILIRIIFVSSPFIKVCGASMIELFNNSVIEVLFSVRNKFRMNNSCLRISSEKSFSVVFYYAKEGTYFMNGHNLRTYYITVWKDILFLWLKSTTKIYRHWSTLVCAVQYIIYIGKFIYFKELDLFLFNKSVFISKLVLKYIENLA